MCRRHDVLYISDEVVTGFGRLGHFFASEPVFDIIPDIITCAKGLTSGYAPLGAVLISDRLLEDVRGEGAVFSNGFTYSAHPVACAAGLATIEIMESEQLMGHAQSVGPYLQERLRTLEALPLVSEVRGLGLMACVDCAIPGQETLAAEYDFGGRIDRHCQRLGLIVRPIYSMCVMSPPLTITRDQIDELVSILRQGIELATGDLRREGIWK